MKKKLDKFGKITLIFCCGWYYDVLDINNIVMIKTLENIFKKYNGTLGTYTIEEVDDSSYYEISFTIQ
jgi:esterase/lipase superfamily enzyme